MCWLMISNMMAMELDGEATHCRQLDVPLTPTPCSLTMADFLLPLAQQPNAPAILTSRDVCTSVITLKPMSRKSWSSRTKNFLSESLNTGLLYLRLSKSIATHIALGVGGVGGWVRGVGG